MVKEIIVEILNDIDDEILMYDGENMIDEGVIDSFTIMEIVAEIEEKFNCKIDPDDVTEEHFKSIDAIVIFVESLEK